MLRHHSFHARPSRSSSVCAASSSVALRQPIVQHQVAQYSTGDVVQGTIMSIGPKGSKIRLEQGGFGFLPHKLDPLHLHGDEYVQGCMQTGGQYAESSWPEVGLVRHFQVERCEGNHPLLSAQHVDYSVLYKRAQQVAELCAGEVLTARVTRPHFKGLRACCLGADGFIPRSCLPKWMRDLMAEQRGHELIGVELPVLIEEVQPQQRRIRLNCLAALAAKWAALQPADLVTGAVSEVHPNYAWVALPGLDLDGCKARLHRSDFSVDQSFSSLQDVLQVGERLTAMVLLSEAQGRRLNLSTAHLELLAGDMLHDRRAVYATAAQQAAIIRAQMYQQDVQQDSEAAEPAAVAAAAAEMVAAEPPLTDFQPLPEQQQQQQQQLHRRVEGEEQAGCARVLISDTLYQLVMASSGYISGLVGPARPPAVVMAAVVWQGTPADWSNGTAAAAGGGGGDMLSSIDLEQDWWVTGPLAWRAADEREQWQAEQQLAGNAHSRQGSSSSGSSAGGHQRVAAEGLLLLGGDEGLDGEQQWLQPPVHWEEAQ